MSRCDCKGCEAHRAVVASTGDAKPLDTIAGLERQVQELSGQLNDRDAELRAARGEYDYEGTASYAIARAEARERRHGGKVR